MPLKIESGTYTVNRRPDAAPVKKLSKFSLWKNWRRSVHEERSPEPVPAAKHQEVATPEAAAPAAAPRTGRRSRPHSLAVQPLNYQRLDPEQLEQPANLAKSAGRKAAAEAAARQHQHRHPNMTSQESIGSCSLDVEKSASERSDANAGSLSEKTLHSLNLSCNGDQQSQEAPQQQQQSGTIIQVTSEPEAAATPVSNGHHDRVDGEDDKSSEEQQLTAKKPSYLGLACSISGYSGITRYDSKLREGFRSRDSSPGARLITRDTSPAGFRSQDSSLNVPAHSHPPKSQSISPLAMERTHNGYSNGKIEGYSCNMGYSEVDRGLSSTTGQHLSLAEQISPICSSSPNKRISPVGARIAAYNRQNLSHTSMSSSSPKSTLVNVSHTFSESSILNGSSDVENCTLNSSTSEKSFIQQRVERLYGPGALAQGFFFKRSSRHSLSSNEDANKSSNNNNTSLIDESTAEESLKNLPVLRHLRPEFRAQLPVVSPRRPTDGTEQIIKPLKRITVSPAKNDAKEVKESPKQQKENTETDPKMTASVTSLTDQQPAAPKVVLPVLEPSTNSNIVKRETPKKVQDGHYFMSLLNKEKNRLISLAETVEKELTESNVASLPEDAAGKLRSASGKARLLASQKMKQFEGLCQKNINQVPGEEFPTTNEDLAGFWDMVMLQVIQVNDLFEQIERLKKSNWQEVAEPISTPATPHNGSAVKRRPNTNSKVKSKANAEAAQKARESREQTRRQLLEERRRAMRLLNANASDTAVEIFVPET